MGSHRRCALSAIAALLLGVLAAGCGDDDGAPVDFGVPRDSQTVVDGPLTDFGATDQGALETDMGARICPGICRPDGPSGCSGEATCVLEGAGPRCASTIGAATVGSPCEATDQCAPGYACFQRRTGGVCGRICCRDEPDVCGVDEVCRGTGTLVDGTATRYGECQLPRECDVLALPSEVCEPGEACYLIAEGETGCLAVGTGEFGALCEAPNGCAAGFACVGAFESQCARICRLGRAEDCPLGEGTCIAYAQSPEGTGLCTPDATAR